MKAIAVLSSSLLAFALALAPLAQADDSNYKPGTVWEISHVKTEPGQFEAYLDFLDTQWKKIQEFAKKSGVVVSYHVWAVNDAREGEPDLILGIEYKDYLSNADRMAFQEKVHQMMAADSHKLDAQSGERKVLRKLAGSVELQELQLK
ncbi:MAG: hypothetical protein JO269_10770 [Burkholderiaceae bacterium]|nr:hypothetical protein [Burkholderiaceae bacterium]